MENRKMKEWGVKDRKKAHALYLRVMSAIRAGLAEDLSPEDPSYKDIADLCEACFLASPGQQILGTENIMERILRWPHGYCCRIVFVMGAILNADLSFLPNPEQSKAELLAAYNMMSAWIWHMSHSKKAEL